MYLIFFNLPVSIKFVHLIHIILFLWITTICVSYSFNLNYKGLHKWVNNRVSNKRVNKRVNNHILSGWPNTIRLSKCLCQAKCLIKGSCWVGLLSLWCLSSIRHDPLLPPILHRYRLGNSTRNYDFRGVFLYPSWKSVPESIFVNEKTMPLIAKSGF